MTSSFLRALHGVNRSQPPIWLMRQAGRHLASYRALREKYPFLTLCHHPDLITQATLLPLERYPLDAAILFSDILLIAEAMGVGLRFEEGKGPIIERPVRTPSDVAALPPPHCLSHFEGVQQGIKQLSSILQVPLIGFCGAPFTVASYLIEGGASRDLKRTKQWLLHDPASFHQLLNIITRWSISYLQLQIDAGVQAIQLFDSWANTLSFPHFCTYSLAYLQPLQEVARRKEIPVILFCRGSSVFAPSLATLQPNAIGLDWNIEMAQARRIVSLPIALQGNLDPHILYAPPQTIRQEVLHLLESMRGDSGFIVNLGHGLPPDAPEEGVQTLVATVKEWI